MKLYKQRNQQNVDFCLKTESTVLRRILSTVTTKLLKS